MKTEKIFYTVPHLEVRQDLLKNKPLWYFELNNSEGVKKVFKQLKELSGYRYDNINLQWSNIFGHMFTISIYLIGEKWSISVWEHTGTQSIIKLTQEVVDKETDIISEENYKKLKKATEAFVRGEINCSDCKKTIKKKDIAGHYFASSFCEDCWENKWKAIEAKENYN